MTAILYAPNVHHGGGLVLLAALAREWPSHLPCKAILDRRAAERLQVPAIWQVEWAARSFSGRLQAERRLLNLGREADLVICFHNLPPIFACRARVVCYVQNPNLVGLTKTSNFTGWVRVRLALERLVARLFRNNVDQYVVQTPTMETALRRWLGPDRRGREPSICQLPFIDPNSLPKPPRGRRSRKAEWDFLYVSDGQAHKNHLRLFEAWMLLSAKGLYPSLAVTLHPIYDRELGEHLEQMRATHRLKIVNLGHMPHGEVLEYYDRAGAMLFASYAESFGIPFLEARAAELPIIAAELDFVRDMCHPAETFDPFSAVSISRAVTRYLGKADPPIEPRTPRQFIDGLLSFADDVRAAEGREDGVAS